MQKLIALMMVIAAVFASTLYGEGLDSKFQRSLLNKEKATFLDGARVAYYLKTGNDFTGDFEAFKAKLQEEKLMGQWDYAADKELDRGMASYMICQALGIEGGLTMHIFGPSQRYCYKEAAFMGLIADGNQRRVLSGQELLGLLDKASNYKQEHGE